MYTLQFFQCKIVVFPLAMHWRYHSLVSLVCIAVLRSIASCNAVLSPVCLHWRYHSLALRQQHILSKKPRHFSSGCPYLSIASPEHPKHSSQLPSKVWWSDSPMSVLVVSQLGSPLAPSTAPPQNTWLHSSSVMDTTTPDPASPLRLWKDSSSQPCCLSSLISR